MPVVAVNCGGGATGIFGADQYWVGYSGAQVDNNPIDTSAPNAAPAAVYQSYRTSPTTLTYNVTGLTPNAGYNGYLYFEEPLIAGAGRRLLNATVGGVLEMSNFDAWSVAGGKQHAGVAVAVTGTADANGNLPIVITASVNSPIMSGFELFANPLPTPTPAATGPVVAINAGGGATGIFGADQYWVGYSGAQVDNHPIDTSAPNAAPAAVYQSYRTSPTTLTYNVTGLTPNAGYNGYLYFEEPLIAGAGRRLLNATVGGVLEMSNFDAWSVAGGKQHAGVAVAITGTTDANGNLPIVITASVNSPIISGFELFANPLPTPTPAPTGPVIAINSGGGATGIFGADQYWVGYSGAQVDNHPIDTSAPNAAPAAVYQSYRTSPTTLTYNVTGLVPNGAYTGYLYFEEPLIAGAGRRLLNATVGGVLEMSNLDAWSVAGGKQHAGVAVAITGSADANGDLPIVITASANSPIISGFELFGAAAPTPTPQPTSTPIVRRGFLGAFFRAIGAVPFGTLSATAPQVAPSPYPSPNTTLFGSSGYCDQIAANGVSISTGYVVDPTKLSDIVNLGVKWTRTPLGANLTDQSHVFPGVYTWSDIDSTQCAEMRAGITPIIEIAAGNVSYDAINGVYSPTQYPNYQTASDFGAYCGAVAQHESQIFTSVTRFLIPGNEVNTNPTTWPGGESQIAAYTQACYQAIKAVEPNSTVYGFELSMDASSVPNPTTFVQQEYNLGCKVGTCYDALSMHLYLPYTIPSAGTPCFPNTGGQYDLQCVTDMQTAAHAPTMHILLGETGYMVPSSVPDENTKATAIVAEFNLLAQNPYIDGANYSNVDECALYPSGNFMGECLIDVSGNILPGYTALASLAASEF